MSEQAGPRTPFLWPAIAFELALIPAAYAVGWLTACPLRWELAPQRWGSLSALGLGFAAALPLIAGLLALEHVTWRPLARLRRLVIGLLRRLFHRAQWWQLGLLSVAAGVGEELICRGWLQMWISSWWSGPSGLVLGLVLSSAVFGLLHAVTITYAVLAGLVGLYLGLLYLGTGHLLVPITAHAVYDFFALWYLLRGSDA